MVASGGVEFWDDSDESRVDRDKPLRGGPERVPLNEIITRPGLTNSYCGEELSDRPSPHPIAFCHIHTSLTLWPLWSSSLSLPNQVHSFLRDLLNKTAQLTPILSLRGA